MQIHLAAKVCIGVVVLTLSACGQGQQDRGGDGTKGEAELVSPFDDVLPKGLEIIDGRVMTKAPVIDCKWQTLGKIRFWRGKPLKGLWHHAPFALEGERLLMVASEPESKETEACQTAQRYVLDASPLANDLESQALTPSRHGYLNVGSELGCEHISLVFSEQTFSGICEQQDIF